MGLASLSRVDLPPPSSPSRPPYRSIAAACESADVRPSVRPSVRSPPPHVRPHPTWFPLTDHSLAAGRGRPAARTPEAGLSVYRPGLYVKRAHCEIDEDDARAHPSFPPSSILLPLPDPTEKSLPIPAQRLPSLSISITKTQMPIAVASDAVFDIKRVLEKEEEAEGVEGAERRLAVISA